MVYHQRSAGCYYVKVEGPEKSPQCEERCEERWTRRLRNFVLTKKAAHRWIIHRLRTRDMACAFWHRRLIQSTGRNSQKQTVHAECSPRIGSRKKKENRYKFQWRHVCTDLGPIQKCVPSRNYYIFFNARKTYFCISYPAYNKQWQFPANTKHLYNIYTMSAQRLRRWSNIGYMLYKCFVFAGKSHGNVSFIKSVSLQHHVCSAAAKRQ